MSSITQQQLNRFFEILGTSKLNSELDEQTTITTDNNYAAINSGQNDAKKVKISLLRGALGDWSSSTNTLADGVGLLGDSYNVAEAGTVDFGSGNITFVLGDIVFYNGSKWNVIPTGDINPLYLQVLNNLSDLDNTTTARTNLDVYSTSEVDVFISDLQGALVPQGNWNASTNTPDITATTDVGHYWIVSADGSTDLGGITEWKINDWAIKTATGWAKVDNTQQPTSWGEILGTLSAQTDLQLALSGKADLSGHNAFDGDQEITGNVEIVGTLDVTGDVILDGDLTTKTDDDFRVIPNGVGDIYFGAALNGAKFFHYSYLDDGVYTTYEHTATQSVFATTGTEGFLFEDDVEVLSDLSIGGDLSLIDGKSLTLGTGGDVNFQHTGAATYLVNNTGEFYFEQRAWAKRIFFKIDNASGVSQSVLDLDHSKVTVQKLLFVNDDVSIAADLNITEGALNLDSYTVATLPAGTTGDMVRVTDGDSVTYRAIATGGGSENVVVFYDGTNWIYN